METTDVAAPERAPITTETLANGKVTLHCGDCRDALKGIADNSIDSIVTDPPYALVSIQKRFGKPGSAPAKDGDVYSRASAGFMGKQWDTGEVAFSDEFWAECLRILKPGGHVVAFSGTRTYHRMAVAIEDAGFEIRDQLAWAYGSGFPKSHDVSKAIDKAAGAEREVVGKGQSGKTSLMGGLAGVSGESGHNITEPATPQPAEWQGWGTALKPAWEPICLGRKPLDGTIAANVLEHGTGALNIDGCRVGLSEGDDPRLGGAGSWTTTQQQSGDTVSLPRGEVASSPLGRWPANIVHDGSDEVLAAFPVAPGQQRAVGPQHGAKASVNVFGDYGPRDDFAPRLDSGSAARFFYSAKADAEDRLGSKHPTVKPVDLMQWLCRLITPPGGTILDPFAGSGSTGEAALREGFRAVLCERETEYQADIRERIRLAEAGPMERRKRIASRKAAPIAGPLFGDNDNAPPHGRATNLRQVRGSAARIQEAE